jgi:hypothetical protein
MPKAVSNEQRLANRQNARHSTGPKTPTGKARSPRTSRLNSTIDNSPRALAELRRLRQVPSGDTTRKNCTRKTNPFETDT